MTRNSTERKNEQFVCRLDSIDEVKNHPCIDKIINAGVIEVTQWDLLRTIRTQWHVKQWAWLGEPFHVAVSNREWTLSPQEMRTLFKQSVSEALQQAVTQKSLPSS